MATEVDRQMLARPTRCSTVPVLVVSLDYDHVTWLQSERSPVPVDGHTPTTQSEQDLDIVVRVPMRTSPLIESHSIESYRLSVIAPE
jgi:hypothetical protein